MDRTVEVVIKISEQNYKEIKNKLVNSSDFVSAYLMDVIRKGVELPDGHGNIVDMDYLDVTQPEFGADYWIRDKMREHLIDAKNGDDVDKIYGFAKTLVDGFARIVKMTPIIVKADR